MATTKITKRIVDEAKHPGVADGRGDPRSMFLIYDTDIKGFALKVTPAGGKVFVVDWRQPGGAKAPKGRFTIGKYGSPYTVDMARDVARDVLAKVREGINPNSARTIAAHRATDLAFGAVADRFVETYAKRHQPRSWQHAERILAKDIKPAFGSRPVHEITRGDIAAMLRDIAARAPVGSRYAHATLRKLLRWAVEGDMIDRSPMEGMKAPAPVSSRDRHLDDSELAEVWRATEDMGDPFGGIYRLLIATGQRRDEVGGMTWAEIDMAKRTWTIPANRAKNGKAHIVPLNDLAMETLERLADGAASDWRGRDVEATDLLFSSNGMSAPSGWSKTKARCDALILAARQKVAREQGQPVERVKAMPGWRVHDLRRTMATGLQRLGVRLEVTEAVLNHISGSRSGIVGVYQRHNWADEKRAALDAWGRHVEALIAGQSASRGNVIPMERPVRRAAAS